MRSFLRCCIAALVTLAAATPSIAIEEFPSVNSLLKRMAEANRQLSYQGIFSYEHGGALNTVKILHAVRDGQEFERIIHLNGPKREVVRRGNHLNCQRLGDAMLRGMVSGLANFTRSHLENHYGLYIKGEDRVAGRIVTVVHVVPKDEYRYGYALGIDKETGLLLQSMLIGPNKRVLERFQFVDVSIGVLIDEMSLEPSDSGHHSASLDPSDCLLPHQQTLPPVSKSGHWRVSWLPPGFSMAGSQLSQADKRDTLIFTDGLAVFSVFIDGSKSIELPKIQAQRGATVAYLNRVKIGGHDYNICVVGEIPSETARLVAEGVIPQP